MEGEIESNLSPESAKYSIARLEIEKNRKIKSIELANKNLIRTSKEFKTLKKEFEKDQKELHSNLKATKSKLENQKEKLFNQYEEHEEINRRISELDFESDSQKQQTNDKKIASQIDKGKDLQLSARQRALLNDKKESFETEIDDLEVRSVNFHETLQKYDQHLSYGYEEVEEFQYLQESLKGLSRAFNSEYWNYAKLISGMLKLNIPIEQVVQLVEELNLYDSTINTWKNGVSRALRNFIKPGIQREGSICPSCFSDNALVYQDGCSQCIDCGFTECS